MCVTSCLYSDAGVVGGRGSDAAVCVSVSLPLVLHFKLAIMVFVHTHTHSTELSPNLLYCFYEFTFSF